MRKFLTFFVFFAFFMAGVSVGLGWAGEIELVETLVFTGTFIGLAFLIDWEIRRFECMG